MIKSIKLFNNNVEKIDKLLFLFVFSIPLFLAISIFVADLLTSISGIILSIIIYQKKNNFFFKTIKKEIIYFLLFYIIILISLVLSNYKGNSFLPSFFYFRYFLLSLAIFYFLKKYNFMLNLFSIIVISIIIFVIIDSIFQFFFGYNIFGYQKIGNNTDFSYLTSFFNDEKKLGSYFVRFLPLVLCLIYFTKPVISKNKENLIIIFILSIIFMSSERTALLLAIVMTLFYISVSKNRIIFLTGIITFITILTISNNNLTNKYILFTLHQFNIKTIDPRLKQEDNIIRYYSKEHEDLAYTGIIIFKNNALFGSGIKSFYNECEDLKKKNKQITNKRNNKLICSTHPHSTYIQIISEIGIFGFLMILFLFIKLSILNLKIFIKNDGSDMIKSYFFINCFFIINLMPFIPSGSFFNNWMSIMFYFPLGFWLYIHSQIEQKKLNN